MNKESIDFTTMASNLGFDEDEFKEVAQLLVSVSLSDMEQLEQGIATQNSDQVKNAAHSIKGASGNLGFMDLAHCAETIENSARSNDIDNLSPHIQTIKKALNRISNSLMG